jgi:NTP pyrophosphatase (non-canonical NTP hydrolase)
MTLDDYQRKSREFAHYPRVCAGKPRVGNLVYPALALAGEAGEVANLVKKLVRQSNSLAPVTVVDDEDRAKLGEELGDVLWYVSALATELGFTLEEVAKANLTKLAKRYEKG